MHRRSFLETLAIALGSSLAPAAALSDLPRNPGFVRRGAEGKLELAGKPFRYIGADMPEVTHIRTDWDLEQRNRFRLPTTDEIDWMVEASAQANFKVIRTWCFPSFLQKELPPQLHYFHRNADGRTVTLNEEGFRLFDYFLARCAELGLRAQVPFVFLPEIKQWADDRGDPHPQLLDFAGKLIARVNSRTGVAYKHDPTIFAWESGNESRPSARWIISLAAHVKRLDAKHLFIDGRWGGTDIYDSYSTALLAANTDIDAVSIHTYERQPKGWSTAEAIERINALLKAQNRALGVGEISPHTSTTELKQILDTVIASGVSGAVWWSFKGARAKGGYTQWNGKEWGGNDDLKWPGFVSDLPGVANEKAKVDLLCDAAYAIRGEVRPKRLPIPTSAKLLPIRDCGHISWIPGTGEQIADIQRSTRPDGEFQTIMRGFETFKGATFDLFCDSTAENGHKYYYRVVSRNSAGAAPASNVVGPVHVERRWLVDDLWDFSRTSARSAGCEIQADYDLVPYHCDLSVLKANADEEHIDYRLDGRLRSLLIIANNDTNTLRVEASADGQSFAPLPVIRTLYPELHPEFAGHPRVTYRTEVPGDKLRWVRIRFGKRDVISRIEASFE